MLDDNLLIESEYRHAKVFRVPSRKAFPKKFILLSLCAILTLIIIGGFVFCASVSLFTGNDRQQGTVAPPNVQSTKQTLLNYFRRISSSKTISGIEVESVGGSGNESVQTIQKIAGVSPGIISTQMPRYTSSQSEWNSFIDEAISNWNNQHLVRIEWWEWNPLRTMSDFNDNNKDDTDRKWDDLIKDGGTLNKVWKKELDKIVPHLHKLQSAGVVPIFDILLCINAKFNIWRGRPGVNGSAKLYQITYNYLTEQHNLTSLIWNWSLWHGDMTKFEEFWPGSEYVDVASVYMVEKKELPKSEYDRLINLVGDKPLAMEWTYTVPSVQLLAAQPRWTWFNAYDAYLESTSYNTASNIKATFNSTSVINKGNIDFFNDNN